MRSVSFLTPSIWVVISVTLLRWQLGELFGKSFKFEIDSEIGAGTTAKLSIPLQIHPAVSRRT
jgi:hypothetical protein